MEDDDTIPTRRDEGVAQGAPRRSRSRSQIQGFEVSLDQFANVMKDAFKGAIQESGGLTERLPEDEDFDNPFLKRPFLEEGEPDVEEPEQNFKEESKKMSLEYYYDPTWRSKTKQELINEFDRIGSTYIEYADEDTKDLIKRLDLIRKLQAQNRAMASYVKGEQKIGSGFSPTSMFSSEKITAVANNGSPIGKVISFTNKIDQITIKADGNGGYYGVQGQQRYGPRTYKEIERWAYLGGFQASEMKVLKNIAEIQRDPSKLKPFVFRARKL
jgi:hypothetical protein